MSLPHQLIYAFAQIKTSALVSGSLTNGNVREFVDVINKSIPSKHNLREYSIYKFNRLKYLADKQRFLNDIAGFNQYESMILWTDFQDILSFFGLSGTVYLGWDKSANKYRGYLMKVKPTEKNDPPTSDDRPVEEAMDDDMHRVFEYMRKAQERMANITANKF